MSDTNIVTLAHVWDERKHNPVGWWMSEKLDGMRAVWTGSRLLSRNGKTIHAPEWWTGTLPKNKQLDGELFLGRGKFQKLVSICRRQTPVDEDWLKVGYLVFDVIDHNKPWLARFNIEQQHPVVPVPHYMCHSVEQLMEFYNSIVDNGGEGVMLRNPEMRYTIGRSWSLLKVKPELTLVTEVVGYYEGKGKYTGMLGSLICRVDNYSPTFYVGSGLTDLDRTDKYKPALGAKITVAYQCLTDAGIPRFPRFVSRVS